MNLTFRSYLLLGIGFPLAFVLAIFLNNQTSILLTIIYDLLILVLTFVDRSRIKKNQVAIIRKPLTRLSVGRDNIVSLQVSSQQTATIEIKDDYPQQFTVNTSNIQTTLPANSIKDFSYTIYPVTRGEYQWGDISIRQLGNWGLAWYDWQVKAAQKVTVYPDLIGLRSLAIRLTLENTGAMRQARKLGQGTEFAELREYSQGDDIRLIDWKATARRNRPLVRVLEPEKEQTLFILLDRGRLMTAQVQKLKRFDWGLNATLSLASAGLSRGDRVGVG